MLNSLIEELKVLAEKILKEEQTNDIASRLSQSRELYERFLVLKYLQEQEQAAEMRETEKTTASEKESVTIIQESTEDFTLEPEKTIETQSIEEKLIEPQIKEEPVDQERIDDLAFKPEKPSKTEPHEEEPVLSLNDLFVPTFDGIKEDMSQKAEFKDTISLDETENLFQVKKEESRQLSLNDKLVGSSIQVGLNDRIAFVNKLFNFSQSDFNKALSKLNACHTKDEALKYFQYQVKPNYNWKGKEELEERFVSLIERKFL